MDTNTTVTHAPGALFAPRTVVFVINFHQLVPPTVVIVINFYPLAPPTAVFVINFYPDGVSTTVTASLSIAPAFRQGVINNN